MRQFHIIFFSVIICAAAVAQERTVDYRYAPGWHCSTPAFPDDSYKTLAGPEGQLLYGYPNSRFFPYTQGNGFRTVIHMLADENQKFGRQYLHSAKVPFVITESAMDKIDIVQTVFSTCAHLRNNEPVANPMKSGREDVILTEVRNNDSCSRKITPVIVVNSESGVSVNGTEAAIGEEAHWVFSLPAVRVRHNLAPFKTVIELETVEIAPDETFRIAGLYDNGLDSDICNLLKSSPEEFLLRLPALKDEVQRYWEHFSNVPYGHIVVPDAEIQNLADAAVRGIWQAREIADGNISFQVGPTCYRGLWIVDGAFISEAAAMLGKGNEARNGIEYTLAFQNDDGGFAKLNPTFWKENGIVLWTCVRHALLTGDKEWLLSKWEKLSRTVEYIIKLRRETYLNDIVLDDGLIPPGYIDGGLNGGKGIPEYSNVLWNLAGLKAIISAADWVGRKSDAERWRIEYDDFYKTFQKAANRDLAVDDFGNRYLNNMMDPAHRDSPQRAQWAFCQSVYPGQIFDENDPVVSGTIEMLAASLQEGMVMGTGWLPEGIWNYFASFYGHACLWTGNSERAVNALYAFANHASPLYVWREEHCPRDLEMKYVGDMPHNWGSAEFIRLLVHLLAIDRGDSLHLLEGLPEEWLRPGMETALNDIATPFGSLTFLLKVDRDGRTANIEIQPLEREICSKIVLHTGKWGTVMGRNSVELEPRKKNNIRIKLNK